MVYYIRFLKPPVVSELDKKSNTITSVITVTTDLGDISLPSDVELIAQLVDAENDNKVIERTPCKWKGGRRTVNIFFTCEKGVQSRSVRVHVTTQETEQSIASYKLPDIFDVWSATFKADQIGKSASLVERQFSLSSEVCVRIWEETGNTIARHIWDAAVGCLQCFQGIFSNSKDSNVKDMPSLAVLLGKRRTSAFHVLELGAGCGIAGIALAQMMPDCSVFLTDLPEAQEMLQMNIDNAQLSHGSSAHLGLLEWGTELPSELLADKIDLVLISDCTYNADSCYALVDTLSRITQHSPEVQILVALKRRHDAEALFEYIMDSNGINAIECTKLTVPHRASGADTRMPVIEMYLYERGEPAKTA